VRITIEGADDGLTFSARVPHGGRQLSVRNVVPTLTSNKRCGLPSMVGAKQLTTLGLSWFRPGPYVQQGCARGTVLLCTGVPVVGWLQARRERRRGLQVPSGVIEASANIVEELRNVCQLFSDVAPRGEGVHLPFIDQGGGELQVCRTV
jgi:hypothetical protein